ncbi:MAG: hypothetical protein Tsb0013_21550 [Phycisphaerales bacterium]
MFRKQRVQLAFAALIALCSFGAWGGVFAWPEGKLHDAAVSSGLYAPDIDEPPRIVVVGIDDRALEHLADSTMGEAFQITWPWARSVHAAVIDELGRLGARTIAFDISFGDAKAAADDAALRESIRRHGGVILAARLAGDIAWTPDAVEASELVLARIAREESGLDDEPVRSLVVAILTRQTLTAAEERAIVLLAGEGASSVDRNAAARMLDQALMWRIASASPLCVRELDKAPVPVLGNDALFPTPAIAMECAGVGNTDMGKKSGEGDGVVRRVPLWIRDAGHAYPMLGLAGAMHYAGVTDPMLRLGGASFGGAMHRFPTRVWSLPGFDTPVAGIARVRWPSGGRSPVSQFDVGDERRFFSVLEILNLPPLRARISRDVARVSEEAQFAAAVLGGPVSEEDLQALTQEVLGMTPDEEAWVPAFERLVEAWDALRAHVRAVASSAETDADTASFAESYIATEAVQTECVAASDTYRAQVGALAPVRDALVFIGSVATKQANDLSPTSIDQETPGVFVHAAIAHNALSGAMLVPAHPLGPPIVAAVFGVLGLIVGARFPQWTGLVIVSTLAGAWFVIGSSVVDARLGFGSLLAPAILTIVVVWLARSTYRALTELRARRRTEARFKSYVAPDVVDILVNNPELSSMEPQKRELTIMFTDIAGFTTMAERLGTQRTTDVLSEYLAEMTDVLESTGATLDKYLGDGIMAFWGAPLENPDHASAACRAGLEMLERLDAMNERGLFAECGPAAIRVGIATGTVSVGDFGNPPLRSAYTVIGDSVNLSARLESANKQLGTTICINERCAQLVGDAFLTRAVGPLVVVGKSLPEPIREVIGTRAPRGARTGEWVDLCEAASGAFLARQWDEARRHFERLRDEFDDGKIAALHLEAIERLVGDDTTPPSITLTEK